MLDQVKEQDAPVPPDIIEPAPDPETPTRQKSRWVGRILRIVVSVGIISWLAWHTDWQQIRGAFQVLRTEYWVASVAVCMLMQVLSGIRWKLLARPLGFTGSIWRFTAYYFIGMYFNLLLPTSVGGDVVRTLYLNSNGHRRLAAFLTVIVDRATGLLILLMVACIGVIVSPVQLEPWIVLSVGGMAAAALLGILLLKPASRLTRRFERMNRLKDYAKFYLRLPRLLLSTSVISLGVQAANVLSVWLLGVALSLDVPLVYYWIVVPLVCILTLLPISVGGIGVREACMVALMAAQNVDKGTALCLSMLWFSVLVVVGLFGGLLYLFGGFRRPEMHGETEYIPSV